MTDELDQAYADAQGAAAGGAAGLLEQVADRIGQHAGATAVFGEPVEQDGRTVIPVAQVAIGAGAGGGTSEGIGAEEQESAEESAGAGEEGAAGVVGGAAGAGGGALSRPLGYIEVSADGARFVPLKRPWADPPLVIAYALLALVIGRVLVRVVRG